MGNAIPRRKGAGVVGIRTEGGRTQNRGGGEEGKTHVVLSTIISARDPARVGVCACAHLHGHGHHRAS